MYTVLLVDDEPIAFKSIRTVLEKRCEGFEIVDTCVNGQDGLEAARKWRPDIIITDIKMPVMDGIEMAMCVKRELPDTKIIILSGYQDFEYAKSAIESGVCEYLLKPIVPSEFIRVINRSKDDLQEMYWQKRNCLLQQICRGVNPENGEMYKYFGNGRYYAILIRKNGLPKRIAINQEIEIFSIKQEQLIMYGRDVQEGMHLYPEELMENVSAEEIAKSIVKRYQDGNGYVTAVMSGVPLLIHQFAEKVAKFYRVLAEKTVVGKNQIIFLEQISEKCSLEQKQPSETLENLVMLLKAKKYTSVAEEARMILGTWIRQEPSQLWLEGAVRQLFYLLKSEGYLEGTAEEMEYSIEDAFYYATSVEDLEESIFSQIEKKKKEVLTQELKMDTPEYFQQLREYIWKNMAKPLTLQQICKHFGVSQPYVSKFFRKYEGTSFGNYLTKIRIQKAKELLRYNKDILIKDVAYMVGYSDQFYFSRIFRSMEGVSPSEYIQSEAK